MKNTSRNHKIASETKIDFNIKEFNKGDPTLKPTNQPTN